MDEAPIFMSVNTGIANSRSVDRPAQQDCEVFSTTLHVKCIHSLQAFNIAKMVPFLLSRYVNSKEIVPTMLEDTHVMSVEVFCLVE